MLAGLGCQHAEPRWLIDRFPGDYPEVVYYFPTKEPLVALTIDDGPDGSITGEMLDVLQAHGAKATFFVLTDNIPGNEAVVRRMVVEGHELGNHLTEDEVSARLPPEEFQSKLDAATRALTEYAEVRWFRPGSAWYNEAMLAAIQAGGYRIALGSILPLDTVIPSPGLIANYVKWNVEPGSIITLHDVGGRGRRAVKTLQRLLPELEARGYSLVTLSELDRVVQRAEPD